MPGGFREDGCTKTYPLSPGRLLQADRQDKQDTVPGVISGVMASGFGLQSLV